MKISVHALHKTGSMFLYQFYKEVSAIKNVPYVSINDIEIIYDEEEIITKLNNYFNEMKSGCYCPNRLFPENLDPNVQYIFLLRNPLDTLVSEYYSWGWIHAVDDTYKFIMINNEKRQQVQRLTVDEYCLQYSDNLFNRISTGILHKNKSNVTFVSYEEMVLDFKNWIVKAVKPFNLNNKEITYLYNMFKHEFEDVKETLPDEIKNGVKNHKRKMYPGDHKDKLKQETINILNEKFNKFNVSDKN